MTERTRTLQEGDEVEYKITLDHDGRESHVVLAIRLEEVIHHRGRMDWHRVKITSRLKESTLR